MFKYSYSYSYLQIDVAETQVLLEFSKDTFLGSTSFVVKSNLIFKDDDGEWQPALGVGVSEQQALKMCLKELSKNLNVQIGEDVLKLGVKIELPVKLAYEFHGENVVLYFTYAHGNTNILTPFGPRPMFIKDSLVKYVGDNKKYFEKFACYKIDDKFLKANNILNLFDLKICKYQNI